MGGAKTCCQSSKLVNVAPNKPLKLDKISQGKETQNETFSWNLAKFKMLPGKSSEKCILAVVGGEWILSIDTGK